MNYNSNNTNHYRNMLLTYNCKNKDYSCPKQQQNASSSSLRQQNKKARLYVFNRNHIYYYVIIICFILRFSLIYFTTTTTIVPFPTNFDYYITTSRALAKTVRYVKDVLCNGCRYSYSSSYKNTTCYYEIQQLRIQNSNLTIIEAAIIIASYNTSYCQRCHPNNGCIENDKIYYRPDDVISGHIEYATTHLLQSIHKYDRIQHNVLMSNNILKEYISNPYNILPYREYYFEFNPSIVQLPKSQIPIELLIESGYDNINIDVDQFYIASYRVTTGYHCLKDKEEKMIRFLNNGTKSVPPRDFLGIAILDINLNIILETVVNPNGVLYRTMPNARKPIQDSRLFNLNNQLYLGSFTKLYPIWINPPTSQYPDTSNHKFKIVLMKHYMKSPTKLFKVWTDEEEKYNKLFLYIHQKAYCSADSKHQQSGKNLNYFYDNNNNHIVMELYPMGPKEYLNINNGCIISNQSIDFIMPNASKIPLPSYSTTDEIIMSYQYNQTTLPYSDDRGSACCISIIDPRSDNNNNNKTLLVGISHQRAMGQMLPFHISKFTYNNRFYAMESYPPYNVIAISGRFCLEYPKYNNNNSISTDGYYNHNIEINFTYPRMSMNSRIGKEQYKNCPAIQFISGMTEAIHDTNKVIISYGIDDCLSRFIMIDKKHILTLLFNPNNMISTSSSSLS